jgi:hypothetical protein
MVRLRLDLRPYDVWTYWHGQILHTAWPRSQVAIDIQWGKHGSLSRNVRQSDLPRPRPLNFFYAMTIFGTSIPGPRRKSSSGAIPAGAFSSVVQSVPIYLLASRG